MHPKTRQGDRISDPYLPTFMASWIVTDDTGNMLEVMSPEGQKSMLYKHVLDSVLAAEYRQQHGQA
jgi:hypothetical protein